ncbi:hypothetical protein ABZP36_011181 [Zizania latifolia]
MVGAERTELMLHRDDDKDVAAADMEKVDSLAVDRLARVAMWCNEPNPALRPTMHHQGELPPAACRASRAADESKIRAEDGGLCLVNDGMPVAMGSPVTFTYAWKPRHGID